MYDLQFSPKTSHELLARVRNRSRIQLSEERARASAAEDDSASA
jgi:hypothetical protein